MKTTFVLPRNANPAAALFAAILISAFTLQPSAFSQPSTFSYQGRLDTSGQPTTGLYDLSFTLYDAYTVGNTVGATVNAYATPVTNGLFTALLDFGTGAFDGNPRFLQIAVRPTGSTNALVALAPRQFLSSTPYAIQAATASALHGTLADTQLSPNIPRLNGTNTFTGTVNLNPSTGAPFTTTSTKKIANLNADLLDGLDSTSFWKTTGNIATSPTTNFLGTLDNSPLELRVNNQSVMRLDTSGNVGIGTSTPASPLHISQSGGDGLRFSRNGYAGYFRERYSNNGTEDVLSFDSDTTTQLLTLGRSGRVSIGRPSPETTLDVQGDGPGFLLRRNDGGSVAYITGHQVYNGGNGTMWLYRTNGSTAGIQLTALGDSYFTGGNVGIGTATPQERLYVAGNVAVSAPNQFIARYQNSNNDYSASLAWSSLQLGNNGANYIIGGRTTRGGSLIFVTDNTNDFRYTDVPSGKEVMRLTETGNVGIGTSNPRDKAHIDGGSVRITGSGPVYDPSANGLRLGCSAPGGVPGFSWIQSWDGPLAINSYGNAVGIGTTNPSAKLEVAGQILASETTSPGHGIFLKSAVGPASYSWLIAAQEHVDGGLEITPSTAPGSTTFSTPALVVKNNGNVGILNANPTRTLHAGSTTSAGPSGHVRIAVDSPPENDPGFEWLTSGSLAWSLYRPPNSSDLRFYEPTVGDRVTFKSNGNVGIGTTSPSTKLEVAGTVTATAFNPASDRNLKENFADVSPVDMLEKVATLPMSRWNFKGDPSTPHVGPMAQDFHAAFGLGTDDKHIATVDADGVALTAIQGLNQKLEAEVKAKDARISTLESRLADLEKLVSTIAKQGAGQ